MPKIRNNDNMELAGKDAETLDHLDIAGGKAKWYSLWKQLVVFFKT